jgi:hypothetical protein
MFKGGERGIKRIKITLRLKVVINKGSKVIDRHLRKRRVLSIDSQKKKE